METFWWKSGGKNSVKNCWWKKFGRIGGGPVDRGGRVDCWGGVDWEVTRL